jgi:hypothetical protein
MAREFVQNFLQTTTQADRVRYIGKTYFYCLPPVVFHELLKRYSLSYSPLLLLLLLCTEYNITISNAIRVWSLQQHVSK